MYIVHSMIIILKYLLGDDILAHVVTIIVSDMCMVLSYPLVVYEFTVHTLLRVHGRDG